MNIYYALPCLENLYPIPIKYKEKAMYCRILHDGSKTFYYDDKKDFLCEVYKVIE